MTGPSAVAASPVPRTPPAESQMRLLVQEWRAGWRPGLAAVVGNSLGIAFWLSISSLFVEPLQKEFGWSRGDIAFAHSAGLITAFLAPVLGRLVDRLGPRPILLCGLTMVTLCYVALSQLNGSLNFYYIAYFLLTLASMTTTGMIYSRIIVGTFTRTRGTSLATLRIGSAIAQSTLPVLVLYPAIAHFGSSGGFLAMAAISGLICLPIIWLFVPTQAAAATTVASAAAPAARWGQVARQPKAILISFASALNIVPLVAIMTQLTPMAASMGLSPAAAAGAVSALGFAHGIGSLIAGVLADRVWAPAIAFANCLMSVAGCLALVLLGQDMSAPLFYVAAVVIGLGIGAETDVVAYLIARYFGVGNFGTVAGIMGFCIGIGMAVGSPLIGYAYDAFGNYQIALVVAAACVLLSGIAYLMLGKYPADVTDQVAMQNKNTG